jgi:hypothetical protein
MGPAVRAGARLGQFAHPEVWRRVHPPLSRLLADGSDAARPHLTPDLRRRLQEEYADDVALLERLTGQDFGDWLSPESRGSYAQRAKVTRISARR